MQQAMFLVEETMTSMTRHRWSLASLATLGVSNNTSTCPPDKSVPQGLFKVNDWLRGHFKEVRHRVVYKVARNNHPHVLLVLHTVSKISIPFKNVSFIAVTPRWKTGSDYTFTSIYNSMC